MDSLSSPDPNSTRAQLIDRLRERLEAAEELTAVVRAGLKSADVASIENATARLQSLVLEFRVLAQEYQRLPAPQDDPIEASALAQSRGRLEQVAMRIARSAAVGSGLLERLVALSRNLIALMDRDSAEGYQSNGRARELPFEGFRLKELA